jgi:integrase
MARRTRSPKIETRSARLKLPVQRKPFFVTVGPFIAVGYRRLQHAGRWIVRQSDGRGGNWQKAFATADDFEDANGSTVLDFWQAQDKARLLARGTDEGARPITLGEALADYARDLERRGAGSTNASWPRGYLTAALLAKPVALLTAKELRRWRDDLELKAPSINRMAKGLKAALNLAAAHDPRITNANAWRLGLAGLPDSYVARNVILSDKDVLALVTAAWEIDSAIGLLTEAAAVTGARASQLAGLEVSDLQDEDPAAPRLLMPSSRKGKGKKRIERRPIPIPASLAAKLRAAIGERTEEGAALSVGAILLKADGSAWNMRRGDQRLPFQAVAERAKVPCTMYALRHSSIVRQLLRGVPIRVVAASHDTSVAMIEKTYSKYISDHADAVARLGLLDPSAPAGENVVALPTKAGKK